MDSILTTIKKLLGLAEEDTHFDVDITIHINSVFMILNQIGLGPDEGFFINDKEDKWQDFIQDSRKVEGIKTYMYLKVRLIFDPPSSTALIESMNRQINEYENRFVMYSNELKTEVINNDLL